MKKEQIKNPIFIVMPWVIFLQFMQVFNENVFNVVTPNIAVDFGIPASMTSWIVTVAFLAFGIGGGVYAVMADIISMKKLFIFGTITFSIGSILGFIFAFNFWFVVIGRLIQAIGAGVIPSCLIVFIARYVPEGHKAKYFGYITAMFQLSAGIGHLAGGYIATHISWEFGFLLPLITLICLPAFMKYLPSEELKTGKLDIPGVILLSVVVLLSMLALTHLNLYLLIPAIIATIFFIYYCIKKEKNQEVPFVSFSYFKEKKYTIGIVIAFLVFGVQNGMFFIFPFVIKDIYHLKTSTIGLMYIPANFAAFLIGMFAGKIAGKIGREKSTYLGLAIIGTGLLMFTLFIGESMNWMVLALLLFGCGYPFFFVGFYDSFTLILPEERIGTGMGVFNILLNLFGSITPTLIGLIVTHHLLEMNIIFLDIGTGDDLNHSNIMFILFLAIIIGGILFKLTFNGIDKQHKKA